VGALQVSAYARRSEQALAATNAHYHVRALDRALQLLNAFSLAHPELSLSELAAATDLPPSTTLRLLSILTQHGYVEKSPATDRYRIGVAMFERGSIYIQSTSLESKAADLLADLARDTNQTASLAVLDRADIVHIAVVQPDRAIRYYAPVGQREMAHCTGLGKVLLSGLSDTVLQETVEQRGLPGRTDRTITTLPALRAHLASVRDHGYAVDNEESLVGLRCVAAPIYNERNRIAAAVSASGSAAEFTETTMPDIIDAVRTTGSRISNRLGYRIHQRMPT
jgi:DNA-binding IclR family transcriptional regulator